MGEYRATVEWKRDGGTFTDLKYSWGHRWSFDGGIEVRCEPIAAGSR